MRAQIRSTKSMDLQFVVINPGYRADQLAERTERRNSMEEEKKELQAENLEEAAGGVGPTIKMPGPCPKCGSNNATYIINPKYKTIKCDACGHYEEIRMG